MNSYYYYTGFLPRSNQAAWFLFTVTNSGIDKSVAQNLACSNNCELIQSQELIGPVSTQRIKPDKWFDTASFQLDVFRWTVAVVLLDAYIAGEKFLSVEVSSLKIIQDSSNQNICHLTKTFDQFLNCKSFHQTIETS